MRRTVVPALLLAAAGAVVGVSACGDPAEPGGDLVASPNPIDFGQVAFPEQKTVEFTLSNRSDRSLLLGEPSFGCPCFALTSPAPAVLGPGESRTLTLLIDSTKTDPRRFHKTMRVPGDGGKRVLLEVPIQGEVVQYWDWGGVEGVELGVLRPLETGAVERRVPVRPGERFRLEPRGATANDPRLRVSLVPTEGGGADLVLTVPEDAAAGPISAQVSAALAVEGRGHPAQVLRKVLWVRGAVEAGP